MKKTNVRKLTVLAMISALGFVAMFFFRFSASFLTFDFKDAIMSIASLLYGPIAGVASSLLVSLIENLTMVETGPYGLIMDIISSAAFLIPCGIVYKYKRSFSGAIIAAVSSVVSVVVVMAAANLIITPYYMHVEPAVVIAMLPTVLIPFNLCKSLMNASVMLLIYKPITNILRKTKLLPPSSGNGEKDNKKTLYLSLAAIAVLVISIVIVLVVLKGDFTLFSK